MATNDEAPKPPDLGKRIYIAGHAARKVKGFGALNARVNSPQEMHMFFNNVQQLREFVFHKAGCNIWPNSETADDETGCRCGLNKLCKALGLEPRTLIP